MPTPIAVTESVAIARAPDDVFAYVADFAHGPAWQRGVREARWTSAPPVRVGSTYEQTARFLGRPVVSRFRVEAYDPSARVVSIASTESTFPITVTRSVTADGPGARYTEDVAGSPRGLAALAAPLVRAMVGRSVRGDQRRLQRHLEER